MEQKLLAVILHDSRAWRELKDTLSTDDFSDLGNIILSGIADYYQQDSSATSVDVDILKSRIKRSYTDHAETLEAIIDQLQPVSVPNVLSEYVDLRIDSLKQRIAGNIALNRPNAEIRELMNEYEFLIDRREAALNGDEDDTVYIGTDIDDIFDELDPEHLIQLAPSSLTDRLDGGVLRGHHIVIFARPETGKSLFVINLAMDLVQQDLKVLYIGNEDPATQMRQRMISCVTGMHKRDILAQPDRTKEIARERGFGNLVYADLAPGSVSDVRRLVHKYKPDVFIVDQIRNLHTTKNLTKVEGLEYIAQSMRNLGKEANALAISVTQAGDSADNKLSLEMGDIDFSNTGIPSTADIMIGLGVNHEYERMNRRMISLPKNKVSGIHEAFPINVDPSLSRVSVV